MPTFTPNPTDISGTYDTSGNAGAVHGTVESVTKVFEEAHVNDLTVAARALDPNDHSVHPMLVTLPTPPAPTHEDPAKARDRVLKAARAAGVGSSKPKRSVPEPSPEPAPQS